MDLEPFYKNGLKFSCQQCSCCCRHEPGFVYLSEKDLTKILMQFNIERESFIKEHCRWVPYYDGTEVLCLNEKENNDCCFWDNGCTIYQARPVQCRTYPFWDFILKNKNEWKECAKDCPGIDKGETHSYDEILEKLLEYRHNEPIHRN